MNLSNLYIEICKLFITSQYAAQWLQYSATYISVNSRLRPNVESTRTDCACAYCAIVMVISYTNGKTVTEYNRLETITMLCLIIRGKHFGKTNYFS